MIRGRLALVNSPQFDYCDHYHCAGDCGLPHNQEERAAYVQHALAMLDTLNAKDRRKKMDSLANVRAKAKDAL